MVEENFDFYCSEMLHNQVILPHFWTKFILKDGRGPEEGPQNFRGGPSMDEVMRGPCTTPAFLDMGGPLGGPPLKMVEFSAWWGGRPPPGPPTMGNPDVCSVV